MPPSLGTLLPLEIPSSKIQVKDHRVSWARHDHLTGERVETQQFEGLQL
jgi:hypothetical protein